MVHSVNFHPAGRSPIPVTAKYTPWTKDGRNRLERDVYLYIKKGKN
jgi:hypothetical protein